MWAQRIKTADGLKHVPLLSYVSECGVAILLFEYFRRQQNILNGCG